MKWQWKQITQPVIASLKHLTIWPCNTCELCYRAIHVEHFTMQTWFQSKVLTLYYPCETTLDITNFNICARYTNKAVHVTCHLTATGWHNACSHHIRHMSTCNQLLQIRNYIISDKHIMAHLGFLVNQIIFNQTVSEWVRCILLS